MYLALQKSGIFKPCFVNSLLDSHEQNGEVDSKNEHLIKTVAAQIYIGSSIISPDVVMLRFLVLATGGVETVSHNIPIVKVMDLPVICM